MAMACVGIETSRWCVVEGVVHSRSLFGLHPWLFAPLGSSDIDSTRRSGRTLHKLVLEISQLGIRNSSILI